MCKITGADPGFFLGGGAPLRNDITDGEVKKKKSNTYTRRRKLHLRGGGAHPLHPPPRSASGSGAHGKITNLEYSWYISFMVSFLIMLYYRKARSCYSRDCLINSENLFYSSIACISSHRSPANDNLKEKIKRVKWIAVQVPFSSTQIYCKKYPYSTDTSVLSGHGHHKINFYGHFYC